MMKVTGTLAAALVFITTLAVSPVVAQNPTQNNQPIRGELHTREVALKKRIQALYDSGRINDTLLASMQRDLDGICSEEDAQRAKASGFTDSAREEINKKLDVFEKQLVNKETSR